MLHVFTAEFAISREEWEGKYLIGPPHFKEYVGCMLHQAEDVMSEFAAAVIVKLST